MRTTLPVSTISYNSFDYLKGKLDDLVTNNILTWYVFIEHQPEEDENKFHFHVYMVPAKRVDIDWLRSQFDEFVPGEKLPRRCLPVGTSKFVDWYWYDLHDKDYLASKGQSRKYHYTHEQMVTNEQDYFNELVRCSPNPTSQLLKAVRMLQAGKNAFDIAVALNVKIKDVFLFLKSFTELQDTGGLEYLDRASRTNHEEQLEHIESEDF